jgi:hypothetical protein
MWFGAAAFTASWQPRKYASVSDWLKAARSSATAGSLLSGGTAAASSASQLACRVDQARFNASTPPHFRRSSPVNARLAGWPAGDRRTTSARYVGAEPQASSLSTKNPRHHEIGRAHV